MANRVFHIQSNVPPPVALPKSFQFGQPAQQGNLASIGLAPVNAELAQLARGATSPAINPLDQVGGPRIPQGPVDVQFDQAIAPFNAPQVGPEAFGQLPGQSEVLQPTGDALPAVLPPGAIRTQEERQALVDADFGGPFDDSFLIGTDRRAAQAKEKLVRAQALHKLTLEDEAVIRAAAVTPTRTQIGLDPLESQQIAGPLQEGDPRLFRPQQVSPFSPELQRFQSDLVRRTKKSPGMESQEQIKEQELTRSAQNLANSRGLDVTKKQRINDLVILSAFADTNNISLETLIPQTYITLLQNELENPEKRQLVMDGLEATIKSKEAARNLSDVKAQLGGILSIGKLVFQNSDTETQAAYSNVVIKLIESISTDLKEANILGKTKPGFLFGESLEFEAGVIPEDEEEKDNPVQKFLDKHK